MPGSCSDHKVGNVPDWQEQPGQMTGTQMPLHSIQMLHIWGAQPVALAKIRMALGLAITDNQHPRHGMTTFVRQMLPASDIPVPQPPSGRVHN